MVIEGKVIEPKLEPTPSDDLLHSCKHPRGCEGRMGGLLNCRTMGHCKVQAKWEMHTDILLKSLEERSAEN